MEKLESYTIVKSLYYYEKLLGLCPFFLNNDVLSLWYFGAVYNVVLIGCYSFCYFLIIGYRFELRLPRETTLTIAMDGFALTMQYCTVVTSWISLTFYQKRLNKIFSFFIKTDSFMKDLNLPPLQYDNNNVKNIGLRVLLVNVTYIAVFLTDHLTLSLYTRFQEQACVWVWFNIPKIIIYNMHIIFIELILILQHYYKVLNKVLYRSFSQRVEEISYSDISNVSLALMNKLKLIGQFHESLTELLENIIIFFRLTFLFAITANFIHVCLDIYAAYQFLTYGKIWERGDFSMYSMNLIWSTMKIVCFYFLSSVPDSACIEVCIITIVQSLYNDK